MTTTSKRVRRGLATSAAAALIAGGLFAAAPATAAPNSDNANSAADCAGRGVPASKISLQLFSYLGWQTGFNFGGPPTQGVGIEHILGELQDIGYQNVEPFGTPGATQFSSFEGRTAGEFRDLLKDYGISAPSAHNYSVTDFETSLADAKDLGQKYIGSGGFPTPGIGSYENVLATAAKMNELGEQSVKNGTGKLFGHNHASEFTTQYADPATGELKSAWQILVENTDPRWVAFQVDAFWATDAGVDVAALLDEYGDRIELLHIKDGSLNGAAAGTPGALGEGDIEWGPILKAAQGKVKLYVVERDWAPADRSFAEDSFEFLTCYEF